MSALNEAKVRQLLLREFRANHSLDQAYKNIRFILGPASITRGAVLHWFENFNNGQTKIFENNFNEEHLNLVSNEKLAKNAKALLANFIEDRSIRSVTTDGRMQYAIEYDRENHQPIFVITDLFHAKKKQVFLHD